MKRIAFRIAVAGIATALLVPAALASTYIFSMKSSFSMGGGSFLDGDIVAYDTGTDIASLLFSESLFAADQDVDAVHVLANGHILLSTDRSATLGGLSFRKSDVVEYNPFTGLASLYFDGSAFAGSDEDVDAVHLLANGHLVLSTLTSATIDGQLFHQGDLIEFDPTSGSATRMFSESLFASGTENIDAVEILSNGHIVLSTDSDAVLGGVEFMRGELVEYDPMSGTASLYFSHPLLACTEDNDAIALLEPNPVPEPTSLLLMGLGLAGAAATVRRRRS